MDRGTRVLTKFQISIVSVMGRAVYPKFIDRHPDSVL
jgi:hypothetical protein